MAGKSMKKKYRDIGMDEDIIRNLQSSQYWVPSAAIQERSLKPIFSGRNVIAVAESAAGKTVTTALSICQMVDKSSMFVQAVVLCPGKDLAYQIRDMIIEFSFDTIVSTHACVYQNDVKKLKPNLQVIVGAPKRVLQMIENGAINIEKIKLLIIDESNEMLRRGFKKQIYDVYSYLPMDLQIVLISSKLSTDILEITSKIMIDPVRIVIDRELAFKGIKQSFVSVAEDEKYEKLCVFYEVSCLYQASVIFCNTKTKADWLVRRLQEDGYLACAIHGKTNWTDRIQDLVNFKHGEIQLIVSTDGLERILAIRGGLLVINYDLPTDLKTYRHRIGIQGGLCIQGEVINLVTKEQRRKLGKIARNCNVQMDEWIPTTTKHLTDIGIRPRSKADLENHMNYLRRRKHLNCCLRRENFQGRFHHRKHRLEVAVCQGRQKNPKRSY